MTAKKKHELLPPAPVLSDQPGGGRVGPTHASRFGLLRGSWGKGMGLHPYPMGWRERKGVVSSLLCRLARDEVFCIGEESASIHSVCDLGGKKKKKSIAIHRRFFQTKTPRGGKRGGKRVESFRHSKGKRERMKRPAQTPGNVVRKERKNGFSQEKRGIGTLFYHRDPNTVKKKKSHLIPFHHSGKKGDIFLQLAGGRREKNMPTFDFTLRDRKGRYRRAKTGAEKEGRDRCSNTASCGPQRGVQKSF